MLQQKRKVFSWRFFQEFFSTTFYPYKLLAFLVDFYVLFWKEIFSLLGEKFFNNSPKKISSSSQIIAKCGFRWSLTHGLKNNIEHCSFSTVMNFHFTKWRKNNLQTFCYFRNCLLCTSTLAGVPKKIKKTKRTGKSFMHLLNFLLFLLKFNFQTCSQS